VVDFRRRQGGLLSRLFPARAPAVSEPEAPTPVPPVLPESERATRWLPSESARAARRAGESERAARATIPPREPGPADVPSRPDSAAHRATARTPRAVTPEAANQWLPTVRARSNGSSAAPAPPDAAPAPPDAAPAPATPTASDTAAGGTAPKRSSTASFVGRATPGWLARRRAAAVETPAPQPAVTPSDPVSSAGDRPVQKRRRVSSTSASALPREKAPVRRKKPGVHRKKAPTQQTEPPPQPPAQQTEPPPQPPAQQTEPPPQPPAQQAEPPPQQTGPPVQSAADQPVGNDEQPLAPAASRWLPARAEPAGSETQRPAAPAPEPQVTPAAEPPAPANRTVAEPASAGDTVSGDECAATGEADGADEKAAPAS